MMSAYVSPAWADVVAASDARFSASALGVLERV